MSPSSIRLLFIVCGLYDFIIGATFLFFGPRLFDAAGLMHPNHWGYIQFASLLLAIFGCMFLAVAVNPRGNRNLIPFGMLLKVGYVGIVAYYWVLGEAPLLFKPFAVIDAIMLVLFVFAYRALGQPSTQVSGQS